MGEGGREGEGEEGMEGGRREGEGEEGREGEGREDLLWGGLEEDN